MDMCVYLHVEVRCGCRASFLDGSSPLFVELSLSLNQANDSVSLVGQWDPGICMSLLSPKAGSQYLSPRPAFDLGSGDLNSRPPVGTAVVH